MPNVGGLDRVLRFVIGLLLIITPFVPVAGNFVADWGNWKYAVALVGLILLLTAVFRVCLAYRLFGIRTCPVNRA
jgi:hypothetical protein